MSIPATMTVIEVPAFGPPSILTTGERPVPSPAPGEVLVKVVAAGVNRADAMQRAGNYPPPPGASDVLGLAKFLAPWRRWARASPSGWLATMCAPS